MKHNRCGYEFMYHAFYSLQQERVLNEDGSTANYYLDENGKEIKITEVSRDLIPTSKWGDLVYVGTVIKWSRASEPVTDKLEYERAKRIRISEENKMREQYTSQEDMTK